MRMIPFPSVCRHQLKGAADLGLTVHMVHELLWLMLHVLNIQLAAGLEPNYWNLCFVSTHFNWVHPAFTSCHECQQQEQQQQQQQQQQQEGNGEK